MLSDLATTSVVPSVARAQFLRVAARLSSVARSFLRDSSTAFIADSVSSRTGATSFDGFDTSSSMSATASSELARLSAGCGASSMGSREEEPVA